MSGQNTQRTAGRGPGGPRGHGGHMMRPVQKAKDFKGTLKRLVDYLNLKNTVLLQYFSWPSQAPFFPL
jgi:ATP-binding cassette subfamily B protein